MSVALVQTQKSSYQYIKIIRQEAVLHLNSLLLKMQQSCSPKNGLSSEDDIVKCKWYTVCKDCVLFYLVRHCACGWYRIYVICNGLISFITCWDIKEWMKEVLSELSLFLNFTITIKIFIQDSAHMRRH